MYYVTAYEITKDGIDEIAMNQLLRLGEVTGLGGLEIQILYGDEEYFQASFYACNNYTTIILGASIKTQGRKLGGRFDQPIMISTNGGFAGVLCSYLFVISHHTIDAERFLLSLGLHVSWRTSEASYRELKSKCAKSERISGFKELMNCIDRDDELRVKTNQLISKTRVYDEQFFSSRNPMRESRVSFRQGTTLAASKEFANKGKRVAALNFANPLEPGGGILRGATAQEESICRVSNLYQSLISENAELFYEKNDAIMSRNQFNSMFLGTDEVIYSPNVLVIKESAGNRSFHSAVDETYLEQPYCIDVISCAAPFFSGSGYILPNGDLQHLFERRIRNIFEAAIDNRVDVIVLGAFGCGAFHNPPDVVAEAFRSVVLEERYRNAFEEIIFAVKRTAFICPNIEAFERNFTDFPKINLQGDERRRREETR